MQSPGPFPRRPIRLVPAICLALLLAPADRALRAEVRSSASYSVSAEIFSGGGGLGSASTTTGEGTVVPLIAGRSSAPGLILLHGFITGMTPTSLSSYDAWALARGLTPGVDAGFFDDPNGDGRPNIHHFAFESDPLGDEGHEGKRRLGTVDLTGAQYLTLTVPVRFGALFGGDPLRSQPTDGLTYEILGLAGLIGPVTLPVVELVPAHDDDLPPLGTFPGAPDQAWSYRTFRLLDPIGARDRSFLKAGVSPAP